MENKEIKFFYKKTKSKGSLMIELLIASAIIVSAFLASSGVAQKSLQVSRQSVHAAQASFLLEEGAEAVRILRDNAWSNITSLSTSTVYYPTFSSGTWTLSATPSTVDIFTRTVELDLVERDATSADILPPGGSGVANVNGTKLVTVNVSWPEGGTTITKTLSFYISNIFE